MKILTIAATPFFADRGCHMRIYNEAKYLQQLGAKVRICTYHHGRDVEGFDICRIGDVPWYHKLSPGFSWAKPWLDLKLFFLVLKQIKEFQPAVIHAHLYEGLAVGYLARIFSGQKLPIILDLQGDLEQEFESYNKKQLWAKNIFSQLAKIIINWADYLVVSSENALKSSQKVFKKLDKIAVIQDGVNLELFSNQTATPNSGIFKKIQDWKQQAKLLVYTGSVEESKGVGDLMGEFSKAQQQLNDWKLLIAGHGQNLEEYQKYISENNLEEKIKLLGATNFFDLPTILGLADLAIDPKTGSTESSGKVVNYMAAGLPIVCYDNEFNRQFLQSDGFYLKDIKELPAVIANFEQSNKARIQYDLKKWDEKKEASKLWEIIKTLK